jgi:hypothetical protein
LGHHTYDHRVDDLMALAANTEKRDPLPTTAATPLARLIDRDVEVQRLIHHDSPELVEQLPDREIWALEERQGRLEAESMDASVITAKSTAGLEGLLDTARVRIYASDDVANLDDYLAIQHPDAVVERTNGFRRIDLMAESYRAETADER